jgi:uncharacterized membrane protein
VGILFDAIGAFLLILGLLSTLRSSIVRHISSMKAFRIVLRTLATDLTIDMEVYDNRVSISCEVSFTSIPHV